MGYTFYRCPLNKPAKVISGLWKHMGFSLVQLENRSRGNKNLLLKQNNYTLSNNSEAQLYICNYEYASKP